MSFDAPDAGGAAPSISQAQAQAFSGANAVGSVTSTGAGIAPAVSADVPGVGGGGQFAGRPLTIPKGPAVAPTTPTSGGQFAGRPTASVERKALETSLATGTATPRPLKIGETRPTITHTGSREADLSQPTITPRAPAAPGPAQPTTEQAPTPEPISQAPEPAPAPTPAPEKPRPAPRARPLNQAGRRRNRFFARRGRSSIQVNQPAGAGLSIRRSGISGAF